MHMEGLSRSLSLYNLCNQVHLHDNQAEVVTWTAAFGSLEYDFIEGIYKYGQTHKCLNSSTDNHDSGGKTANVHADMNC